MSETSETILVVLHKFGPYEKGQIIADPASIAAVIAGGHRGRCIATVAPDSSLANEKGR